MGSYLNPMMLREKTLSSQDQIPAPGVKLHQYFPTGPDRGIASKSRKAVVKCSYMFHRLFADQLKVYHLNKAIQALDEIVYCTAYYRRFLEYNQRVTPGGLDRYIGMSAGGYPDKQNLSINGILKALERIDDCKAYLHSSLGNNQPVIPLLDEDLKVIDIEHSEKFSSYNLHNALLALETIGLSERYLRWYLECYSHPVAHRATNFNISGCNLFETSSTEDLSHSLQALDKIDRCKAYLQRSLKKYVHISTNFNISGCNLFETSSTEDLSHSLQALDKIDRCKAYLQRSLKKYVHICDISDYASTLETSYLSVTSFDKNFINRKCFYLMRAHRFFYQGTSVSKENFLFPEELGPRLLLDYFTYNTNYNDHTENPNRAHFLADGMRASDKQRALSKDLHIDIFDDNPPGINWTLINQLKIIQGDWTWINQFQKIQVDDDSMMLNKTTLALLGQATGAVMSQIITSPSSSSWTVYSIVAAILAGISFTLAGIRIRRKKQFLSTIMSKIGAMATATAIVISLGSLLHPVIAWIFGTIACSLLAITLAFA